MINENAAYAPSKALSDEIESGMSRVFGEKTDISNWDYFQELARKYFLTPDASQGTAYILGTGVSEEIIHATGLKPRWLVGGSFEVSQTADPFVPRDTDAVHCSIYGYALQNLSPKKNIMIVPIACDCQRKLAYCLSDIGWDVKPVDIPPDKSDDRFAQKLSSQYNRLAGDCSALGFLPGFGRRLRSAVKKVDLAKKQLAAFLEVAEERSNMVSGLKRIFIINSYYYAENLDEWTLRLRTLTEKIRVLPKKRFLLEKPKVLIIGSPVLFPNYKIPCLLEQVGIDLHSCVDSTTKQAICRTELPKKRTKRALLESLANKQHDGDLSAGYVINTSFREDAVRLVKEGDVSGIIYHVLKGQIEYDFELEHIETLVAQYDVPVFRVETDYYENDVEQLRLRLEAFKEMLSIDIQTVAAV